VFRGFAVLLWAVLTPFPGSAATLYDLLPGVRADALGAYTALGSDAEALFFNPAGIAGVMQAEFGGGLGRTLQPGNPIAIGHFSGAQPLPQFPGGVAGAAVYGVGDGAGTEKNVFLLGFAQPVSELLKLEMAPQRLRAGLSVRAVNLRAGTRTQSAVGLDAGLLWAGAGGTRLAAAVMDLDTKLPVPGPAYHLGASHDLGWAALAADFRLRRGSGIFYPGVEFPFEEGLLDLRIGKGTPVHGVSQVALGLGFHLSPLSLDFMMSLPWRGLNVDGGTFAFGVSYRIGAQPYLTRLVGKTAESVSRLKDEAERLRRQRETLQRENSDLQAAKALAEVELRDLRLRIEEESIRVKAIPAAPPPEPAPAPASPLQAPSKPEKLPESWPKKHKVRAGDTLRSLAAQYYGDATLWEMIYEANKGSIVRGLPEPGSELVIPNPQRK